MRISVIGTGYLGAVHAACMPELGHEVIGIDADPEKIAALAEGRAPFYEPGLPELLSAAVEAGRLQFSTSLAAAAEFADLHFICDFLVIGKSTVPVGAASQAAHTRDSATASLAWNLEFLREGQASIRTTGP
jgi:UDPglucose 6-dehydrogenase